MSPLLLLLLVLLLTTTTTTTTTTASSTGQSYATTVISEKGLDFVKDLLISEAVESLIPLDLPDAETSASFPFLGGVHMSASNITLDTLAVANSTIHPGDTGVAIVAAGVTANLSMDWNYTYTAWFLPIELSDSGNASIQVEDMEVGLTMSIKNQDGVLDVSILNCSCYMKNLVITLDGGASWFYQGFINAFEDHIRSAVESAITQNIIEGTSKLDSFLQGLPKTVTLDNIAAMNMTIVDDPHFGNASIELDINGLFAPAVAESSYLHEQPRLSLSCGGASEMLLISLDEAVFNSASDVYFKAGLMHWIVDKVPDQSLLNTASWKFIIPRLYWKYPNDDMVLNISVTSSPVMRITSEKIGATIYSDMIVDVLDGTEKIPVACISVEVSVSGVMEVEGNILTGRAELDDFSLALKWSKVGNFYMSLIQGVMRVFLNTIAIPYLNARLGTGFPLPVIHGFTLKDAYVSTSATRLIVCSDVIYTKAIL